MDGMDMDQNHDHGGDINGTNNSTQPGGGMTAMSMMHMTFFWGKNADILFDGWPGTRTGMYVLALIFVFVLAVLVEWLSHCQFLSKPGSKDIAAGFMQSVIHTIRVGLAYLVMLALMSFNGGVFLVAILGHFVGRLFFGSRAFNKTETGAPIQMTC